jgi:hypothetical protein
LTWVVIDVMVILYTGQARNFFRRLYAKANIRLLAAIPFVIGLLLLLVHSLKQRCFGSCLSWVCLESQRAPTSL